MYVRILSLLLCAQISLIIRSNAATFTVTTTADSGAGSLRQAITDANANAGLDVIEFNIAPAGEKTITPSDSPGALPTITDPLTIDGTTQPGFAGKAVIELAGTGVFSAADGLRINTSNCVIRGLVINRFSGDGIEISGGGNNVVEGCILGLDVAGTTDAGNSLNGVFITNSFGNRIGGSTASAQNIISGNDNNGVRIEGAGSISNIVSGNIIGLDITGALDRGNTQNGIYINGAPANTIGGTTACERNLISANDQVGILFEGAGAERNLVIGNYIGTDIQGLIDLGNSNNGIRINLVGSNRIGGPNAGNLISGNNADGINITGATAINNVVFANKIGLTSAGGALPNDANGIQITLNASGNVVGAGANLGNTIAFNNGAGVYVLSGTNNTIRANTMFSNAGQGIDLDPNGASSNDVGDADGGPNQRQNFPILTAAVATAADTQISGTLNSAPIAPFTLDFYSVTAPDSSGAGEGQQYLGNTFVTTDASGNVTFSITLPIVTTGRLITVTATDDFGNTSEFSPNINVETTIAGSTFTVTSTADSGVGSFRQAILDANIAPGLNTIAFNIPGDGPHTIAPLTLLPGISNTVVIDGYTQPGASPNTDATAFNGVIKIILSGATSGSVFDGLSLQWPGAVVRGLNIVSMKSGSSGVAILPQAFDCRVEGCVIGDGLDNVAHANGGAGISIRNSKSNLIGGLVPAARNVISGNTGAGIDIAVSAATGNTIVGNNIGVSLDGLTRVPNNRGGIQIAGGTGNTIGGATPASRNVISGNNGEGINLDQCPSTNIIQGNFVGTDVTGNAPLRNTSYGIALFLANSTMVGGDSPAAANIIAFNDLDGVDVNTGTNNVIRGNSIHDNGGLGIDLEPNNTNANDVGDGDTGANNLQNYPVLTGAMANLSNTGIQGTLNSKTNTTYEVDFYSNLGFESAGNYEGEKYLGSTSVTTDASGNGVFDVIVNGTVNGRFITATATDPDGNTSEFSKYIRAESTIPTPTLLVTTTADSGAGSLRQALLDAGSYISGEPVKINFNIPGADPYYISPLTALPVPTEAVAIDGYSQPGASPNTLAIGNDAVLKIHLSGSNVLSAGLRLTNSGNIIRGLSIIGCNQNGLEINGNSNRVEGCFIGLDSAGAPHANSLSGIRVGPVNIFNDPSGGRNNIIGGSAPSARNVISGNSSYQLQLDGGGTNIVQGNYIGTTPSGAEGIAGFISAGIYISSSRGNLIGGAAAGEGNVISGASNGNGITIFDTGISSTRVVGNIIGADSSGAKPVPNKSGIVISSASGDLIGGVNAGEANLIAFNTADGVNIVGSGTNNTARGNTIFSNGGLAINLGFDSISADDDGDPDTGPNNLQNYPIITAATITPTDTTIAATLNSLPDRDYTIDFYANIAPDQNGYGEAQQYLGSATTTAGVDGNSSFTATLTTVAIGRFIVATATDADGNTSEMSHDFEAASTFPVETFVVTNTNDSGAGSLRQAILDNNMSRAGGNNVINFNIPGAGPHTIAPTTAFDAIAHAATFDGFSQPGAQPNTLALGDDSIIGIQIDGNPAIQAGLNIQAPGCIVRGFSLTHFGNAIRIDSSGAQITGCWIGLSGANAAANLFGIYVKSGADIVIGGTNPADRNVISGNDTFGVYFEPETSGAKIQGNYIGVTPSGLAVNANRAAGLQLSGADHVVGGLAAGAGNVISGNGEGVILFYATNCIVQKNLLGPDAQGSGKFDTSSGSGLSIANSSINNLISGNTISGNHSWGILVYGDDSVNNRIVGNNIGADVNGAPLGNNLSGIALYVSNNEIGGTNETDGNLIAFNAQQGIILTGATNCPIRKNQFMSNGSLAIDLGGDGVTDNDDTDADPGANQLQNYPVITSATIGVSDVQISGYLQSAATQSFDVDFYANAALDSTGNAEGEQYLGSAVINTGANGRGDFAVTFQKVAVGRFISATATDNQNNTSEFSAAFRAASSRPSQTLVVTTDADSGPGSLRQTLIDAGNFHGSGANKIQFNIPGAGLHIINVLSQLPTPSEPVEIDGFTQPTAQPNTAVTTDNAVRLIQIRGAQLNGVEDGLHFFQPGSIARGLIISEFPGGGIALDNADNSFVEGSLIISNRTAGVYIRDTVGATVGATVGGAQLAARNIIFGNLNYGIYVGTDSFIIGASADNRILGNFIGVDATASGETLRAQPSGIMVYNGQGTHIGGVSAGEGNLIAFNDRGVTVRVGPQNRIRGNSIYSNSSLAIDLDYNGFSQNDVGDADTGANNLQNFPVLQSVNIATNGTHLIGALNSSPNADFIIDLYNNDTCAPGGYGEGARYITSINIRTDASGNAPFDIVLPQRFPRGVVTATATDAAGNTSEFSACVTVGAEIPAQTYVVTNTNDSGIGSLRQAILDANAAFTTGRNTIAFNIPGPGIQTISPVTPLPDVSNEVYINGFTQPGAQPNTSSVSVNATLLVRIDGVALGGTNYDGIRITGNDVMARGLIVTRFSGAGIAVIDANNAVVTECFLGVIDPAITAEAPGAALAKKINVATGDVDPDAIYKIYGNRIGLRVDGGQNFSSAPLVEGIVGLLVAGNAEQGAIFTGADTASLQYAYFEYNGDLDPRSGAIRLHGTTGALLEYLWLAHNDPIGIAMENTNTNISAGTIIRNNWLQYNSRPGMGAAIKVDGVGFNLIESNLIRDNFNDGILIKDADGSGQNRIYGNMLMFEGGAGIFLDQSHSMDIGGSLPEQKNSISLNQGGGIISSGSADIRWLNNIFGLANTPRVVGSTLPHGLAATRTTDAGDVVIAISGHGAPNQTVEIAIYKALPTPVGVAFDVYETIAANTDGSGDFTASYRPPPFNTTIRIRTLFLFSTARFCCPQASRSNPRLCRRRRTPAALTTKSEIQSLSAGAFMRAKPSRSKSMCARASQVSSISISPTRSSRAATAIRLTMTRNFTCRS